MSLRVDGHSRGRSRSPGGRDRSRSRDARAPSPSVQVVIKSEQSKKGEADREKRSRKKHEKKYDSSSDTDSHGHTRRKKSSKKRYDSESTSGSSSDGSSDEDRRSKRHSSKKYYSDSDSDRKARRKSSSKKSYSDSESSSDSSSSDDHHHSHHKSASRKSHRKTSDAHHEHDKHHSKEKGYRRDSKGDKVVIMPGAFAPPQYVVSADGRKHSHGSQAQIIEAKPGHRLSVSGGSLIAPGSRHGSMLGGLPPGSPLLEAYRGTYQSISPMPSPLMLASKDDSDISDLSPLEGESDLEGELVRTSPRKKVSFYDPEKDAKALAASLKHTKVDPKPIIRILPHLSHDHIMMLRNEYKKHMKSQGKGVNIAKHVKMKVPGNFGEAAYAVALGQWEAEAHWANFWYQSNSSRRELLIESLMGRSNSDIVRIKDAFSDQRYNNSLEKCMQTELKKDKFRHAVLLALEEKRMSETEKIDMKLVRHDVENLYRALTAKEGGETAMIEIIVIRSNKHLAETLKLFEASYRKNFAREMIRRSQNLVGETLAHILNGVLNRPVRDALLLHQALGETSKDRVELLVSRLVRFHWEPRHLMKIKVAYRQKYGNRVEDDIRDGTKGDFEAFMLQLCHVDD